MLVNEVFSGSLSGNLEPKTLGIGELEAGKPDIKESEAGRLDLSSDQVKRLISSPVTALPFAQQINLMLQWAQRHQSRFVCVANVHMLMEAHWHPEMNQVLSDADLVTPDGMPLVVMLKLLGVTQQDRVAGLDILQELCRLAPKHNTSVYFVGSEFRILEKIKNRLQQEFPNLVIAGLEPLPFRPLTAEEDQAIAERINTSGAGLVFVSLGCPKQELWMSRQKGQINATMIGLGGAFPVYAGLQKRAPNWVRRFSLEWAYRLVQEPARLWKRYATTIPPFLWLAGKQLITSPRNPRNP
jgi:N-acetylglucosaminyldiphosphoundecaprenol N-acetyl-beta-D-mannosaminyltransferase